MDSARRWVVAAMVCGVLLPVVARAQIAPLPQTGQTKCYNSAGTEIPCAGTGQDGDIRAGVAWPSPRFANPDGSVPVSGGAVVDQLTGLMWTRDAGAPTIGTCSGGTKGWLQGLEYVACLNSIGYLGYSDWRLPNVIELESLASADGSPGTWLNSVGFMNVSARSSGPWDGRAYWTSTTISSYAGGAWDLWFSDGSINAYNAKPWPFYTWPVRSWGAGAIALPKTGQTTSYTSGDDGDLQQGAAWPSPRFTNPDGTIPMRGDVAIDRLTGLMWTRNGNAPGPSACGPGATKAWQAALDYVACLNANAYLGYTGWRLPNRREMMSFFDVSRAKMATWLNAQGFLDIQPTYNDGTYFIGYWTSTTYAPATALAWYVWLDYGMPDYPNPKTVRQFVWPVRDIEVVKTTPLITWPNPAAVVFGTALGSAQLNPSTNVSGTFAFNPPAGTVLPAGTHTLATAFTPADTDHYFEAQATVTLSVTKAQTSVTLAALTQTYTGSAVAPTATTVPPGLAIEWTGAPQIQAGTYSVTATISDPNYAGTASGTFTLLTAGQSATNLAAVVNALPIPAAVAGELVASLQSAAAAFDRRNMGAGVNQMQAFQNKVRAQAGKKISSTTAAALIAAAQQTIDAVR